MGGDICLFEGVSLMVLGDDEGDRAFFFADSEDIFFGLEGFL